MTEGRLTASDARALALESQVSSSAAVEEWLTTALSCIERDRIRIKWSVA